MKVSLSLVLLAACGGKSGLSPGVPEAVPRKPAPIDCHRPQVTGFLQNGIDAYVGTRSARGAPTGTWVFERRAGIHDGLRATTRFHSGVQHGPFTLQFLRQPLASGAHKNGLRHGLWRFHYPGGQLMAEGYMEDGHRCGRWSHFSNDGDPLPVKHSPPCRSAESLTLEPAALSDPFAGRAVRPATTPSASTPAPVQDATTIVDPFARKR